MPASRCLLYSLSFRRLAVLCTVRSRAPRNREIRMAHEWLTSIFSNNSKLAMVGSCKSIPRKPNGQRDWSALPDGSYFIEWREAGKRMRLPAGRTVSHALEAQRIKLAELAR